MSKQDRQGVRTASQLEQKYNFGKSFAQVMGVAEDARAAVEVASSQLRGELGRAVSSLTRSSDSVAASVSQTRESVDALQTGTAALRLTADRLQVAVDSVRSELSDQSQAVTELSRHFIFDGTGLSIQNKLTGMGIHIREDQVSFSGGHDPTTVITPNEMHTTNQRVLQRLDLGDFALLPRTNGNLSMRWTGGDGNAE